MSVRWRWRGRVREYTWASILTLHFGVQCLSLVSELATLQICWWWTITESKPLLLYVGLYTGAAPTVMLPRRHHHDSGGGGRRDGGAVTGWDNGYLRVGR